MLKRWRQGLWIAAIVLALGSLSPAIASGGQIYYRGQVVAVGDASNSGLAPQLRVKLLEGPDRDRVVTASGTGLNSATDISLPTYHTGDEVVVTPAQVPGAPAYSVLDHYRLPGAVILLLLVVGLAIVLAGWRGLGSLAGLGISLLVLGGFVVPQILQGRDPYLIVLVGSFVIATLGIYFAHGFSRRTSLALASTYITLVVAIGLSLAVVALLHLGGIATEDVSYLHQQLPTLNIQGLLLGGIMIGVLGVLDDITVGQATAVEELHRANERLSWRELYRRGLAVGREHIASLINTLVLAYAGTSFIFIVYLAATQNVPVWLVLNSELMMEEAARSLVGSLALMLAVPIATFLSSYLLTHTSSHAWRAVKNRLAK